VERHGPLIAAVGVVNRIVSCPDSRSSSSVLKPEGVRSGRESSSPAFVTPDTVPGRLVNSPKVTCGIISAPLAVLDDPAINLELIMPALWLAEEQDMRSHEFRDQLQDALQDAGLFLPHPYNPTETIDLSGTQRRWRLYVIRSSTAERGALSCVGEDRFPLESVRRCSFIHLRGRSADGAARPHEKAYKHRASVYPSRSRTPSRPSLWIDDRHTELADPRCLGPSL